MGKYSVIFIAKNRISYITERSINWLYVIMSFMLSSKYFSIKITDFHKLKSKHNHIIAHSSGSKAHSNTESIPRSKDIDEVFDFAGNGSKLLGVEDN